ncbi:MAG: polysaccharide biosynthesis protein [Bacilli bacterium]|nr:polysaccharide biosynthesis protein [Bacilli bacterium]
MKKLFKTHQFKYAILVAYDIVTLMASVYLAEFIVGGNDPDYHHAFIYSFIIPAIAILANVAFRLYASLWRYAGINEAIRIVVSSLVTLVINISVMAIANNVVDNFQFLMFRWCYVFFFLQMLFAFAIRFGYRGIRHIKGDYQNRFAEDKAKAVRVMIIGAGDAGIALIKEIRNENSLNMEPVCLIDDNVEKQGRMLDNVKVYGGREKIVEAAEKFNIDRIIIAMPSVRAQDVADIIHICQDTKCHIQTLPGVYQLIKDASLLKGIRDVEVEDLLGRDPIDVKDEQIKADLKDKVVLVTGGGGSIGSELCRQIAKCSPKQLIILDFYENNAYAIEQELKREVAGLNLLVLIANVCDEIKMDAVFKTYKPDLVYHAAAHKHVPLMETSPNEAIKNNVIGAIVLTNCAAKYGVKRFLQISTDKAVNPTNIMGASKRICEMVIQHANKLPGNTEFVAVRFGNVLGSNGSVIPLFKEQIKRGGPVCVTHKDITRFFMTIPEAVSLVLQAGYYAKGGEIFVLDMGKPVKIYDLAVNLIRLSGFTPNVDIKIEITGLRPGEKLYEELLMDEEGLKTTDNKLIHIGKPIEYDEETFMAELNELVDAAVNEKDNIRELVQKLVPTYKYTKN